MPQSDTETQTNGSLDHAGAAGVIFTAPWKRVKQELIQRGVTDGHVHFYMPRLMVFLQTAPTRSLPRQVPTDYLDAVRFVCPCQETSLKLRRNSGSILRALLIDQPETLKLIDFSILDADIPSIRSVRARTEAETRLVNTL